MKIHGDINEYNLNFDSSLLPLFNAMKDGKEIKSITCMSGSMNKNDPSKDFKIKKFRPTNYFHMMGYSDDSGWSDYVTTDVEPRGFYMNWIRSFELNK